MAERVTVIGAGSWGTALAQVLALNGCAVSLVTRTREHADAINETHRNDKYLPGVALSPDIVASPDLESTVHGVHRVIVVVPSRFFRKTVERLKPVLAEDALLLHATKGIEFGTYYRMSEVIADVLGPPSAGRVAVLSGPSHAEEVVRRCPTTVVVASRNKNVAKDWQRLLGNSFFRVYSNPDVIGLEIGGALKNIIALGVGIAVGLGYGDNAKAALMTRGLAEIARLGITMGASPMTFAGLAGVGDLIATCFSAHSRNRRAGILLGEGKTLADIQASTHMVAEGIPTTQAAYFLGQLKRVEMPITTELYRVLFEGKPPRAAVEDLMGRDLKTEMMEGPHTAGAQWDA